MEIITTPNFDELVASNFGITWYEYKNFIDAFTAAHNNSFSDALKKLIFVEDGVIKLDLNEFINNEMSFYINDTRSLQEYWDIPVEGFKVTIIHQALVKKTDESDYEYQLLISYLDKALGEKRVFNIPFLNGTWQANLASWHDYPEQESEWLSCLYTIIGLVMIAWVAWPWHFIRVALIAGLLCIAVSIITCILLVAVIGITELVKAGISRLRKLWS